MLSYLEAEPVRSEQVNFSTRARARYSDIVLRDALPFVYFLVNEEGLSNFFKEGLSHHTHRNSVPSRDNPSFFSDVTVLLKTAHFSVRWCREHKKFAKVRSKFLCRNFHFYENCLHPKIERRTNRTHEKLPVSCAVKNSKFLRFQGAVAHRFSDFQIMFFECGLTTPIGTLFPHETAPFVFFRYENSFSYFFGWLSHHTHRNSVPSRDSHPFYLNGVNNE